MLQILQSKINNPYNKKGLRGGKNHNYVTIRLHSPTSLGQHINYLVKLPITMFNLNVSKPPKSVLATIEHIDIQNRMFIRDKINYILAIIKDNGLV